MPLPAGRYQAHRPVGTDTAAHPPFLPSHVRVAALPGWRIAARSAIGKFPATRRLRPSVPLRDSSGYETAPNHVRLRTCGAFPAVKRSRNPYRSFLIDVARMIRQMSSPSRGELADAVAGAGWLKIFVKNRKENRDAALKKISRRSVGVVDSGAGQSSPRVRWLLLQA